MTQALHERRLARRRNRSPKPRPNRQVGQFTEADKEAALAYLETLSGMNPDPVLRTRIAKLRTKLQPK